MNRQQRRAAMRPGQAPQPARSPAAEQAFGLAVQLHQDGRLAEAEQACHQLIAISPRHADGLHLLGLIHLQRGQPLPAAELMQRAAAIDDAQPHFHNNLGSAYRMLDRRAEAIACFRRAVAIRPDYARALINLGQELGAEGKPAEAMDCLRRALAISPSDLEALWALGVLLHQRSEPEPAAECYERALSLKPGAAEILENLAQIRLGQGRTGDAIALLRRGLELKPQSRAPWRLLGAALRAEVRLTEAAEAYRQAIRFEPDAETFDALGNALADIGRLDEAVAAYREALRLRPDNSAAWSNLLMTLHSLPQISAADLLAEAKACAAQIEPRPKPAHANRPDRERRLRIGYVSADFRVHPVGFFLDRVLPAHDPEAVEAFLFSDTLFPDELTERLRAAAHWRPIVGMNDAEAAAAIGADGIDILVDLAGHTASNRLPLFAGRPAPVQVEWLGYFGATGLEAIDYVLADAIVLPPGEDRLFTEQPVRLQSPYLCWSPPNAEVPIGPSPSIGNGFVTFGCLNNPRKMTQKAIEVWSRILGRVEGSRLFLKYWSFADPLFCAEVVRAFEAHGVDGARIAFEGLSPRIEGLAAYNRIDIALDPFPFGGCTTTADTLWMGVPLVALAGERWSGRMSQTILQSLGMEDWATPDLDAYVETAVRLAGDAPGRARLRAELRGRIEGSAFCDGPGFTRRLEAAYRGMWRTWCETRVGSGA